MSLRYAYFFTKNIIDDIDRRHVVMPLPLL